jgi:hypothetical protein
MNVGPVSSSRSPENVVPFVRWGMDEENVFPRSGDLVAQEPSPLQ